MKHLLFPFLMFFIVSNAFSQTPEEKQKAHELCLKGIAEMDKGEIENAITYFEQAKVLDPENHLYPYEIAHGHYLTKQYKKAIALLNPLLVHKNVSDHVYHLLGSSYEHSKNHTRALEVYNSGVERFPKSGLLFHALGNFYLSKQSYKEALGYFEKGIMAEPDFSPNYYWASKLHASLEDKLWGIVYAELFINMEGVTDQSRELGKMIFDVYENGITISAGKIMVDLADADTSNKNFEADFEKIISESAIDAKKEINISAMSEIRKAFINKWIETGNNNTYPNLLFDWHSQLLLKGYWEPYTYWLLKEGNPEEFQAWVAKNQAHYNEFVDWLSKNFLVPSPSNYFVTSQYAN